MSTEMIENIAMMPIIKHVIPDKLMREKSLSNKSILKDLYSLVGPSHAISKNTMGWIWKLNVPSRVRFFWWKV